MSQAHNGSNAASIEVINLRKTYRSWYRKEKIEALKGIDLQVQQGEIFGFLGPNGAGKTTTVKLLLGLLKPDGGTLTLLGRSPMDPEVRRRIGYMPERSILPTYLRLNEMVRLFGGLSGLHGSELKRGVEQAIKAVELESVAERTLDTFSKGMLQRASLAQALVADPDLLLLDEPAIGLDPIARHQLRSLFESLRDRGKTIFLNSHELEVVQLICDRFAILHQGKILAVQPIEALCNIKRYVIEVDSRAGSRDRLLELLPATASWEGESNRLHIDCDNLQELNHVVDMIRTTGTLIGAIYPHSVSLETYFLNFVQATDKNRKLSPDSRANVQRLYF